jgi:hypothetical protein
MGAVLSTDIFEPDNANLVHPDGHSVGSAMATEIEKYLDGIKGKAMVAYAKEVMARGGTFDVFGYDFAAPFRAEVPEDMLPKKLLVDTGARIPDYYSNFGFFFVSMAFKTLVHDFDGDQHQFSPVEIVDRSGAAYSKSDFFIFNCRQVLNTVDETSEKLEFVPSGNPNPGDDDPIPFTCTSGNPFRVFKDKIGDAGLWQELRCLRATFASEAFWQEAKARNLTGMMRYTDFEEI